LSIGYLKTNRENTFSILCFDGSCCSNQLYQFELSPEICISGKFPSLISCSVSSYTICMERSRTSNKLKLFRRCKGYSQKYVARMLGLSDTSTLSRWEHGLALPGIMHTFRLARIYHTLPHELFADLWNQVGSEYDLLAQDEEPFSTNSSFFL
jgi:DNA-binding XRE family transcriptional regulator